MSDPTPGAGGASDDAAAIAQQIEEMFRTKPPLAGADPARERTGKEPGKVRLATQHVFVVADAQINPAQTAFEIAERSLQLVRNPILWALGIVACLDQSAYFTLQSSRARTGRPYTEEELQRIHELGRENAVQFIQHYGDPEIALTVLTSALGHVLKELDERRRAQETPPPAEGGA